MNHNWKREWMSKRVQKRQERKRVQPKVDWKALAVVHPDAAGIDIGGSEHWVAISPDRDEQPVRCFDCFTADLEQMADWLAARGVRTIRAVRTLWRYRGGLVGQASSTIQRMQKALIEMNIQLSNVLSDLSGVSGMAIVQAILEGKRDPQELAALADPQVKASQEVIAKSLHGNWRSELLFVLGQEMDSYRALRKRIAECDGKVQQHLQRMGSRVDLSVQPIGPRPKGKRARGNAPQTFDLRSELYRLTGVDWSQVDGIDVQVAQTVIAEVGTDLKAFPSEKHFANWLGLCPTNDSSGGRVLKRRTPKVVNRAKTAFRQAASTLIRSHSYLGAQYRRLRTRLGAPKAITAMARKLACLFYRLLTKGQPYVDRGAHYYESHHREQQIRSLIKRARQLGLQVLSGNGQPLGLQVPSPEGQSA